MKVMKESEEMAIWPKIGFAFVAGLVLGGRRRDDGRQESGAEDGAAGDRKWQPRPCQQPVQRQRRRDTRSELTST